MTCLERELSDKIRYNSESEGILIGHIEMETI